MKLKPFAATREQPTPREYDAARHVIGHPNDVASPYAIRHSPGADAGDGPCFCRTPNPGRHRGGGIGRHRLLKG